MDFSDIISRINEFLDLLVRLYNAFLQAKSEPESAIEILKGALAVEK